MIMPPSAMTRIPRAIPITMAAYAKSARPLTNSSAIVSGQDRPGYRQASPCQGTRRKSHSCTAPGNKTPTIMPIPQAKIDEHELLTDSELFLDGGIGHGKLNTA